MQPKANVVVHGSGLPVVFVHGMGVDHRSLMLLDDVFPDSLQRLYLDLPGFGRTPALNGPGGLPEFADWLCATIDELVGRRGEFALVGNSMGGVLAREVTAREPRRVRGLALIAPVVDPRHTRRRVGEHTIAHPNPKLTHALPQDKMFDFIKMGVNQSFDAWRRYQRFILPGVELCDREACARLDARYFLDDDPEQTLGTFGGPTLIVVGRHDQIVGFADQRDLLPHYPNARFVIVEDAGHNIHIDQPEQVASLLRGWAGDLLSEGRRYAG